jgi:hypothetical protein
MKVQLFFNRVLKLNAFFAGPAVSVNGARPRTSSSRVAAPWKHNAELTLITILTRRETRALAEVRQPFLTISVWISIETSSDTKGAAAEIPKSVRFTFVAAPMPRVLLLGHWLNA